jgi:hypothetical protein
MGCRKLSTAFRSAARRLCARVQFAHAACENLVSKNSPRFTVALNCGIGSSSLKADVKALEKLQIVRRRNSLYFGSKQNGSGAMGSHAQRSSTNGLDICVWPYTRNSKFLGLGVVSVRRALIADMISGSRQVSAVHSQTSPWAKLQSEWGRKATQIRMHQRPP